MNVFKAWIAFGLDGRVRLRSWAGRVTVACVLSGLIGCAATNGVKPTSGPHTAVAYDRATAAADFARDLALSSDDILQHGRATVLVAHPSVREAPAIDAIYVASKKSITIVRWDAIRAKYESVLQLPYAEVDSVALVSFVRNRQIHINQPQRRTSITPLDDVARVIDVDAAAHLFQQLVAHGVVATQSDQLMRPLIGRSSSPTYIPVYIPPRKH